MAAFPPLAAPSELLSTEDPMELYQDPRNQETTDDTIDIDLDLRENIEDDEMIEDPETETDPALQTDNTLAYDEQMMDDGEEDDSALHPAGNNISQDHDEDLDDVDANELENNRDAAVEIKESLGPSAGTNDDFMLSDNPHIDAQDDIQNTGDHTFNIGDPREFPRESKTKISQDSVHGTPSDVSPSMLSGPNLSQTDRTDQVNGLAHNSPSPSTGVAAASVDSSDEQTLTSAQQLQLANPQAQSLKSPDMIDGGIEQLLDENRTTIENVPQDDESAPDLSHESTKLPDGSENSARPLMNDPVFAQSDIAGDDNLVTDIVSEQVHNGLGGPTMPESNQGPTDDLSSENLYVHPIVVAYQGSEMFLFPPAEEDQDHSQTYLLSDEALAAEVIHTIFKECRDVLEDSIGDEDELVFNVDDLGLRVCESAVEASSTRLIQILDVYLQLHYHDGNDTPPPMKMTLSTNARFSHGLDYLINLAAEGKGFSNLNSKAPGKGGVLQTDRRDYAFSNTEALHVTAPDLADTKELTEPAHNSPPTAHTATIAAESHSQSPKDTNGSHNDRAEYLSVSASEVPDGLPRQKHPVGAKDPVQTDTADVLSTKSPFKVSDEAYPEGEAIELTQQETEEMYDEQYDEDSLINEEDDQDSEDYSPGSSTIQGDETSKLQDNGVEFAEAVAYDAEYVPPVESGLDSFEDPQAEDLDTYETIELEDHNNTKGLQDNESTDRTVAASISKAVSNAHDPSPRGLVLEDGYDAHRSSSQANGTARSNQTAVEHQPYKPSGQGHDANEVVDHTFNADPVSITEGQEIHNTGFSPADAPTTAPEELVDEEDEITFDDESESDDKPEEELRTVDVTETTTGAFKGDASESSLITAKRARTDEDSELADGGKGE
ncbi:MAG: hypothetical protein Q9222_001033 [Ikaeria aurantiellina]